MVNDVLVVTKFEISSGLKTRGRKNKKGIGNRSNENMIHHDSSI